MELKMQRESNSAIAEVLHPGKFLLRCDQKGNYDRLGFPISALDHTEGRIMCPKRCVAWLMGKIHHRHQWDISHNSTHSLIYLSRDFVQQSEMVSPQNHAQQNATRAGGHSFFPLIFEKGSGRGTALGDGHPIKIACFPRLEPGMIEVPAAFEPLQVHQVVV